MKQQHDIATKPYYRCLSCQRFRKLCGGIPTRGMDLKEWCEYIRDVMDTFHLSATFVASESDVSQRKVENIHAINVDQDIMRATARRIELVVLGNVTKHICDMDIDTGNLSAQIADLMEKLAEVTAEKTRYEKIIDQYLK